MGEHAGCQCMIEDPTNCVLACAQVNQTMRQTVTDQLDEDLDEEL